MDAEDQKKLDYAMIEADGTETKSKYGANAIFRNFYGCNESHS